MYLCTIWFEHVKTWNGYMHRIRAFNNVSILTNRTHIVTCHHLLRKLSIRIKHLGVLSFHKGIPGIVIQHTTPFLSVQRNICKKTMCHYYCYALVRFRYPYQLCCKLTTCTRDSGLFSLHIWFLLSSLQYCSLRFKQTHYSYFNKHIHVLHYRHNIGDI